MIHLGVVLSMVGVLLAPVFEPLVHQEGDDADQFEPLVLRDDPNRDRDAWMGVTMDCEEEDCAGLSALLGGLPWITAPPPGPDPVQPPPGGGPYVPPPTVCEPRDPTPPEPDIAAIPIPEGTLTHDAGDGPVVVGMDTEFRWEGPETVSWTQTGHAGVRGDCSPVPAESVTFTANLHSVMFHFEQGERTEYLTDTGSVTHRYTTIPAHEGEEQFTVCVYAGYELPGGGFAAMLLVAELDHDVVEIRSTLLE